MGKASRFSNFDDSVDQQRKLSKSYGLSRQSNSVSSFRTMAKSPQTSNNTNNSTVIATTGTVANSSITFAKIQNLDSMKVIGRTTVGTGVSSEITIFDEDNLVSNSATSLATQQSIKAYVDTHVATQDLDLGSNDITNFTHIVGNVADKYVFDGNASTGTYMVGSSLTSGRINVVNNNINVSSFLTTGFLTTNINCTTITMAGYIDLNDKFLYFDADADTYMESNTDDTLNIVVGGSVRGQISNLGLLMSSPLNMGGQTITTTDGNITMGSGDIDFSTGGRVNFYDIVNGSALNAGTATALPATPTSYFMVEYRGATRYIPYYNV